jgi:hypothetical protein
MAAWQGDALYSISSILADVHVRHPAAAGSVEAHHRDGGVAVSPGLAIAALCLSSLTWCIFLYSKEGVFRKALPEKRLSPIVRRHAAGEFSFRRQRDRGLLFPLQHIYLRGKGLIYDILAMVGVKN